jgi:hypothetical protein
MVQMSLRFVEFSGNFIYQNYRQALERIKIDTPQLAALTTRLGIGPDDFERYLEEERAYLTGLRHEREDVKETADYMDLLFDLDDLQYVLSQPLGLYMLTKSKQEEK